MHRINEINDIVGRFLLKHKVLVFWGKEFSVKCNILVYKRTKMVTPKAMLHQIKPVNPSNRRPH